MKLNFNGHEISGTPEEINNFIALNTPSRAYSTANDGEYHENVDPSYASGFAKPEWKTIYTLVHYTINYDLDRVESNVCGSFTYQDHAANVADQIISRMHKEDAEFCRIEDIKWHAYYLEKDTEKTSNPDNVSYEVWYDGVDVSGTSYREKIRVYERRLDCDE